MKRKFGRLLALVAVFGLLCTSCLGGDEPAAPAGKSAAPSGTEEPPAGNGEVTVGLERDVYAIPDYTNAGDDVRVVRLSVSMNASDYHRCREPTFSYSIRRRWRPQRQCSPAR